MSAKIKKQNPEKNRPTKRHCKTDIQKRHTKETYIRAF